MNDFALRPYQGQSVSSIFMEWRTKTSTLIVLPTGTGKTIVFAAVIKKFKQRAIVLAHVKELIWQARSKIMDTTGLTVDVEMGDVHAQVSDNLLTGGKAADVIVSTRQTQISGMDGKGRMTKFNPMDFGLLIIDECHRSASDSYRTVIEYYTKANPDLRVLGVTATPDRADEKALGEIFESVAFKYELEDAINDGWLVPISQLMVVVDGLDFSSIRTVAGDLNGADLAAVMEAEAPVQKMVQATFEAMYSLPENSLLSVDPQEWGARVQGLTPKRALAFTASVKAAETLSNIVNRIVPGIAGWVCGKTPDDERDQTNKDFATGGIRLLCNCGTHTEGYDNPWVEIIVMGRPTKSRSLFAQMCGRGTRALPGVVDGPETPELRKVAIESSAKKTVLVIDFVGNTGRHKLMTTLDILGGKASEEVKALALKKAEKKAMRVSDALAESEEEIAQAIEKSRQEDAARKAKLVAKASYRSQSIDPFSILDMHPVPDQPGDMGKSVPEKQRQWLRDSGMNPDDMPYGQQKQMVQTIVARWKLKQCSIKQAKILKRHGYDPNMSREKAKETIDAIAASGWKLRAPITAPDYEMA